MATTRKRGQKWQVQVRRLGHPPISKSFASKAGAEAWARKVEVELDGAAQPVNFRHLETTVLRDLLLRYRDEVTVTKRGAVSERYRINRIMQDSLAGVRLARLTPGTLASWRERRLKAVKSDTVRRELTIIRHVLEIARKEWGFPLQGNPVSNLRKPPPSQGRERRVSDDELNALISAAERMRASYLKPIVLLAIETGLRRGELLSLKWPDIDLRAGLATVRETKNGRTRTVALSAMARAILSSLERNSERVFPLAGNTVRLGWERLRAKAGLDDLRFHDLRHEAISRFFEKGLNVPEVALMSGHRDPRMLFRYTHVRAESLVGRL